MMLTPGEVLDKIARRLRVHTLIPELRDTSGIEIDHF